MLITFAHGQCGRQALRVFWRHAVCTGGAGEPRPRGALAFAGVLLSAARIGWPIGTGRQVRICSASLEIGEQHVAHYPAESRLLGAAQVSLRHAQTRAPRPRQISLDRRLAASSLRSACRCRRDHCVSRAPSFRDESERVDAAASEPPAQRSVNERDGNVSAGRLPRRLSPHSLSDISVDSNRVLVLVSSEPTYAEGGVDLVAAQPQQLPDLVHRCLSRVEVDLEDDSAHSRHSHRTHRTSAAS